MSRWVVIGEHAIPAPADDGLTPIASPMVGTFYSSPAPDADASYAAEIVVDLGAISPHVSGPDGVGVMQAASAMAAEKMKVDKAYLLSCTNARHDDLVEAAAVLRGNTVPTKVLVEMVNLSNPEDAALLASARERERISEGLLNSLLLHFGETK